MNSEQNTECSICLEEFQIPKFLPCFHTFCQKCLQSHLEITYSIEQEADGSNGYVSFNCPLCRRTIFSNELKDMRIKNWAESFPTNYYLAPKFCAKHDWKIINLTCVTTGMEMCSVCIIDGHQGCEILISKNVKDDASGSLEEALEELVEAVDLCKESGCELKTEDQQKEKNVAERRLFRRCEKYFKFKTTIEDLQQTAVELQRKIRQKISDISSTEDDFTFTNDVGNVNEILFNILHTLRCLKHHPRKSEPSCCCVPLNETEPVRRESIENLLSPPKEISYFFLTNQNRTDCEKVVSIKILVDCSVIILCQNPDKLVKLSWCGEFVCELLFSHQPSDMCMTYDGQIAICFPEQQRISFAEVTGSDLHVTASFEMMRPYAKIAALGKTRFLAAYSNKLHVLERHDSLFISKVSPLTGRLGTVDASNGLAVLSFVGEQSTFEYDVDHNVMMYTEPLRFHGPIIDSSCCGGHKYVICSDTHCVYRVKIPDGKIDLTSRYLFLGIGKPRNIHVNPTKSMAILSTNTNGDRSLIQIFQN